MRVNAIEITGIRGILAISVQCSGKNVLIYGENGTGKSSIVDAIEFFFTGEISRFKGVQGLSFEQHCPHMNCKPDNMKVGIAFNGYQDHIVRTINEKPILKGGLREYSDLRDGAFILRRSQILTFIISQPAKRYRAIAEMIGVDYLDSIESSMSKVNKELEKEIKQRNVGIEAIFERFRLELKTRVTTLHDIVGPINEKLKATGLPKIRSLEELDTYLSKPEISSYDIHLSEKIQKVSSGFIGIPHGIIPENFISHLTEVEQFVSQNKNQRRKELGRILTLLESGEECLHETTDDKCPLCKQEINKALLLDDIKNRIGELRSFKEESSKVHSQSDKLAKELKNIIAQLDRPYKIANQYQELNSLSVKLNKNIGFLKSCIVLLEQTQSRTVTVDFETFQLVVTDIEDTLNIIEEFGRQEVKKITPSPSDNTRIKVLLLIEQLKVARDEVAKFETERGLIEQRLIICQKIYKTYSETRKKNIQNFYDIILQNVERYYQLLHPDEPISDIRLSILSAKAGSAELTIDYCEREDEDPRAFLSEGHLDSLGLCIFLAFIKGLKPDCPLIILDDVVTTIDSGHRERVCSLIYNEFSNSQIIITTHDGIWNEQLQNYQRAYSISSVNLELIDWTPEMGPIVRLKKSCWETIEEKLKNGERGGAGNEGRRYLEYILDRHCILLDAKILFKGGSYKYGFGELYDAFRSRAKELIVSEDYKKYFLPCIQELERTAYIGNRLSHHNERSLDLSIGEVKSFCTAVRRLDEVLICPECKRSMYYFKDDHIISCSNPNCTHPASYKTV